MSLPLVLYRCGWEATPPNETIYSHRYPPLPAILQYWCTGGGFTNDTFVGLVVAPEGVDPMTVVCTEFLNAVDRGMTRRYTCGESENDRFPTAPLDWSDQRLAYFAATGQLWDKPIVGHYQIGSDNTWWCTTNIELFDL